MSDQFHGLMNLNLLKPCTKCVNVNFGYHKRMAIYTIKLSFVFPGSGWPLSILIEILNVERQNAPLLSIY